MQETIRETKELTIGNHKVVVKTYLTGREMNVIEDMLLDKMAVSETTGNVEMTNLKGSMLREQLDKCLEMTIVSIDGATEGLLDKAKDLPYPDYKQIVAHVESLGIMGKGVASSSSPSENT